MSDGFQYITKCLPTMCLKNNWNAILLKIMTFKRRRKHKFKFRFFKEKEEKSKLERFEAAAGSKKAIQF